MITNANSSFPPRVARGQYHAGASSGEIAAGTTLELFQFRWTDPTHLAVIRRLILSIAKGVTAFTASPSVWQLSKATAWTAQGTGGTVVDVATTSCGLQRNTMPTSLLASGDCRIATTAALGGGTKTFAIRGPRALVLDPTASPILLPTDILRWEPSNGDYPLTLAANEGIVLRNVVNPGTGTMQIGVSIDWMEVDPS